MDFQGGSVVKNLPANAGDMGYIPGSGRSPGELIGLEQDDQIAGLETPLER